MVQNNLCSSLIVYGSYAPGGTKHHLVSDLPGEWEKGFILGGRSTEGDQIYPGEELQVEAWLIKFEDCKALMFSEERFGQDIKLYNRWQQLDSAMDPHMGRTQRSWWPEASEPIRGKNGQQVVNIYLPIRIYPHLKSVLDSPHPEDRLNTKKLWSQQRRREKKYDPCEFTSLIKDATLEECIEMFDGLEGADSFLANLRKLFSDMAYDSGYLLKQEGKVTWFYALPKPEHLLNREEAEALIRMDIEQKAAFLEGEGQQSRAEQLRELEYSFKDLPDSDGKYGQKQLALIEANELLQDTMKMQDHDWLCIREACYGIASNYTLPDYLLQSFSDATCNFEIPYRIWKGGYSYEIHANYCYIQATNKDPHN